MVKIKIILLFLCFLVITSTIAQTANTPLLSKKEKKELIRETAKLVEKYYVSKSIGKEIGAAIKLKLKKGAYANFANPEKLSEQLTYDLRSINGDRHMRLDYAPLSENTIKTKPKDSVNNKVSSKGSWSNYGMQEIKILDGNIGYLKINHFSSWDYYDTHKTAIDAAFNVLKPADALILDVRGNRGGYEQIVAYLISYLYEGKKIHLSDYYVRFKDQTTSLYTTTSFPGKSLPNIPVYVLVDGNTASAGESLAYMLKHLKRATVIGKKTIGAGNGAMKHRINNNFTVTISSETTINAITKTSLEGIGVIPDLIVDSDAAYLKGYRLALANLKAKNKKNIHPSNYDDIINYLPENDNKTTINKAAYLKYVGLYKNKNIAIRVILKGNKLYAEVIGKSGPIQLIHKKDHIFIVGKIKETVKFTMDASNNINKLIGIETPMELEKIKG